MPPKTVELVAPAGSFEILEAAYSHGADAAYIGVGPFNLRAHAPSFVPEDVPRAVETAHQLGRKLYVTLNTMPSDTQMEGVRRLLQELASQNEPVDALIVSDPGVLSACRELAPDIPLHLSTQTGTFNSAALAFWTRQGISRAVLPREFTLDEIHQLTTAGVCETEVFVHGAMCVSVAGRCLLGAYISGRHPNRGDCPQPCRYKYRIALENAEEGFAVEEGGDGVYIMNSKDLCTIGMLPDIVETGVSALKIEGRNKSVHYVSAVVKTYREALDTCLISPDSYEVYPKWLEELDRLDHRPYTTGFYGGEYAMQEPDASKSGARLRVVGVVKAVLRDGRVVVDVKNPFMPNEELDRLPAKTNAPHHTISFQSISDLNDNPVDKALTNRLVVVAAKEHLSVGDLLRRFLD